MHQVEELCDRLVLINQGQSVLYGTLNDVRKKYAGHAIHVRTEDQIPNNLPGVKEVRKIGKPSSLSSGTESQCFLSGFP